MVSVRGEIVKDDHGINVAIQHIHHAVHCWLKEKLVLRFIDEKSTMLTFEEQPAL
jgi:hypothetical protein